MMDSVDRDLDDAVIEAFRRRVYGAYRERGRDFPWRRTRDPWAILVSEFMLQQTRTSRVEPKYVEWMRRYPDARALAAASLSEALASWSGLGYNRRCLALLETARLVAEAGAVPDDEAALLSLPGVGTYTARAVLAFAWDRPVALLETNVRAALLHEFFPGSERVSERALEEVSWRVLDRARPGEWYQALMDYGAELKKRGNPSRAAAVHRPQAKFEGSARQARGRALGILAKSGPADAATLAFRSGLPCDRLHRALESLVADGLVVAENGSYGIAERKGNGKPEEG